jgi:hypothetical protein
MIEVQIDDRFERNGVDIHIFERMGPGRVMIYKPTIGDSVFTSEIVDWHEGSVMPTYPFHVPREALGPLWAALGKLLGSVENPAMLRKDFEHEQRRVDDLIGTMRQLALGAIIES